MTLPTGYRFRAPTAEDAEGVAAMLAAGDRDGEESILNAEFFRSEWARSDVDPATDAWLVLAPEGDVAGYAQVTREEPTVVESFGSVAPAHRDRGIGSLLLDRIEARAAELGAGSPSTRVRHGIDAGDRAAEAMLEARGLRPVRHFWHMQRDLDGPVEPGAAPEGVEIAVVEPARDLEIVHAILDEAFAEDWSYHPAPFEGWAGGYTSSPGFDPSLWLLARVEGVPEGALTAAILGDRGWVNELGVRKRTRGRGVAGALLRRSFSTFAERGVPQVNLNVDAENPTGATALYERAGMRVVKRWDLWERSSEGTG
jgi:mycothiol synthase